MSHAKFHRNRLTTVQDIQDGTHFIHCLCKVGGIRQIRLWYNKFYRKREMDDGRQNRWE